ncbi:DUF1569 domain-containing protein [Saccharibacillus qingshengii]|uniref:DUF1569 domain-containing protein n=1 Tax=Saccharibacillus qingshengii TaxID=1763540 RepID=UPI001551B7C0|nr:DUF1569 domain-containing protein [Saccharibacillus qingshengii]
MNNLFESSAMQEIRLRIERLSPDARPLWGKMNPAQMLAHCSAFQDIATGESTVPRSGLGRVIGRFAKPVFYNDKPLPLNMSTIPAILMDGERKFNPEKERLLRQIERLGEKGPQSCEKQMHPFFGRLSAEEWGKGLYKHLDHHLKQFGV